MKFFFSFFHMMAMSLRQTIIRLEEAFLCILLMAMILLACAQIFFRDFFSGGFMWADPLLRYMVLWAGLLGAAVATRQKKHIAIDLASHLVPKKLAPWLGAIINIFAATVCSSLTYAAVIFVKNEASFGEGGSLLSISSWQLNMIFPLAFGLVALRFLGHTITDIKKLAAGPDQS